MTFYVQIMLNFYGSDRDGISHKALVFVANVNVNGGQLKVNVNQLENSNVWNADNRHRVVVLQYI